MEQKKFDVTAKDGEILFSLDLNQDGEPAVQGGLVLSEALQEALDKGTPMEGAKVVEFKFELTKLKIVLDTDKDGEKLFWLTLDLPEAFDEGKFMFSNV